MPFRAAQEMLDPPAAEGQFFTSLAKASLEDLDRVFADGFILIDVMSGSEIIKSSMLAASDPRWYLSAIDLFNEPIDDSLV